ncbi:MAG: class I SAM-dependent methyltransferase [Clostridia bacterium]|nr:class I SAM-dependent methyltransferase [Clostridia bacterium]
MGLLNSFFNQTRKPEGFLGKLMVGGMNSGHAAVADWGMASLSDLQPQTILDVGCGGGRNIGALLDRYSTATGLAVDYAPVSVEKSKRHNRALINAGRCRVIQADVSALPLGSGTFDLVTAFETVYFWPGLPRCFAEVARVLKSGGAFLIVNESDGTDKTAKRFESIIDGMTCYTAQDLETELKAAGFAKINVMTHETKPWLAVLARKG